MDALTTFVNFWFCLSVPICFAGIAYIHYLRTRIILLASDLAALQTTVSDLQKETGKTRSIVAAHLEILIDYRQRLDDLEQPQPIRTTPQPVILIPNKEFRAACKSVKTLADAAAPLFNTLLADFNEHRRKRK